MTSLLHGYNQLYWELPNLQLVYAGCLSLDGSTVVSFPFKSYLLALV